SASETLRSMPVDDYLQAAGAASRAIAADRPSSQGWGPQPFWFEPTAGEAGLPVQPFDMTRPDRIADVPVICGTTLNELPPSMNAPEIEEMDWTALSERLEQDLGDRTEAAIAAARQDYPDASPADVLSLVSSRRFRVQAVELAERLAGRYEAGSGAPVWQYIFAWQTPLFDGRPRAFHTSDVPFVFHNTDLVDTQTGGGPEPRALADHMTGHWAAFARHGNPNGAFVGDPAWPRFSTDNRATMIFDTRSTVMPAPDAALLSVLKQTLP
ncbi:MAG: carboxylesterase family protein, partial [Pseudomonadota bacterium]